MAVATVLPPVILSGVRPQESSGLMAGVFSEPLHPAADHHSGTPEKQTLGQSAMSKHKPKVTMCGMVANARPWIAALIVAAGFVLCAPVVRAQDFSHDGYSADGQYEFNTELTPYTFIPHVGSTVNGIGPRGLAGKSGSISGWQIVESLRGAFMGDGLVWYGPYSAELNVVWVDLGGSKDIAVPKLRTSAHLDTSGSMVLVTPGVGYQIYRGDIALAPLTIDARVGFQYMSWSASANTAANVLGGASVNSDRVAPWIGIRADLFTMPNWRVRFVGNLTGLGTNNGSWGWMTDLTLSHLVNDWLDVSIGFNALGASASTDRTDTFGTHRTSLHAVAYGPMIGVGFRF